MFLQANPVRGASQIGMSALPNAVCCEYRPVSRGGHRGSRARATRRGTGSMRGPRELQCLLLRPSPQASVARSPTVYSSVHTKYIIHHKILYTNFVAKF